MRVRKKVTLVIEYEQEENGFPANPEKWTWEELLGETVLHVKCWPVVPDLEVGDRVRLTGSDWRAFDLLDEVVTIQGIGEDGGVPWFTSDGRDFAIYVDEDGDDFSAEKVEEP